MQSRRDQVHSYQFFLHRVVSALVARESDPAELPFRRLGGAALGSVMVAVLMLAGVGIYGLVVGGGANAWRSGDTVILEQESGTRYVYRDGRLHPVLNLASARLVLGRPASVTRVSARSLLGVPRGPSLGIPGGPDGTFDNGRLLTGGWVLCSQQLDDGRGGRVAASLLGVGRGPAGGVELDRQRAALVRDVDGRPQDLHLIWNSHRFAIDDPEPILRALGVSAASALPVAGAWLGGLPVGAALGPRRLAGAGGATTAFGGAPRPPAVRVGQLVEAPAGTFYRVRARDLEPMTPLQKDIALASVATAEAYPDRVARVVPLETALLATATVAAAPEPAPNAAPETRPEMVSPAAEDFHDGTVCASIAPGQHVPRIRVGARLPGAATGMNTPQRTEQGALLADRVLVEPGWAALVEALSSADAQTGSLHLVTDQGFRHALPNIDVAGMLGYRADRLVRLPAGLLDRIPPGPALTPDAARQPAG